jgi:pimeloyl-[acyl-carrier protein] methyl ester esterase
MSEPGTILVSGWACPARALAGLGELLGGTHGCQTVELGQLVPAGSGQAAPPLAAGLGEMLGQRDAPVELCGWSTGAMVALEAAAAVPAKVSRLLLLSATPKFCRDDDWPHAVPRANVRAMIAGLRRDPAGTLHGFFQLAAKPRAQEPATVERMVDAAMALGPEMLARQLRYLVQTDLRTIVGQVAAPVLLVHGRRDRLMPLAAAEWLDAHLPAARMHVDPDLGHTLPIDSPAKVAAAVEEFRTSQDRPSPGSLDGAPGNCRLVP